MVTGNMHRKLGRVWISGSREMLMDRYRTIRRPTTMLCYSIGGGVIKPGKPKFLGSGESIVASQPVGELVVVIPIGTIPLTGYVEGMVTEKLLDFMDRNAGMPCYWMDDHRYRVLGYWYYGEMFDCGKKACHNDDLDESSLTHSTAIGYGSRAHNIYVLQCFLWFPDHEHFGFQGLQAANGGEDAHSIS